MGLLDGDLRACMQDGKWRTLMDIWYEVEKYRRRLGPRTRLQRILLANLPRWMAEELVYEPPLPSVYLRLMRWNLSGELEFRPDPEDAEEPQYRLALAVAVTA